jgi:glycosyltransferase involved in cell wall biosynthesis
MPAEPIITIAVPTYNRARLLEATLASVAAQDFTDFRAVILDNASTDHTESVAESFTDARFEYEKSPSNIGFFRNFNRAIEVNRSRYLAIVQDDDILRPGFIRCSIEALERFPQAAMSFSDVEFMDGEGRIIPDRQGDPIPPGLIIGTEYLRRIVAGENLVIHVSSGVMRQSAIEQLGGFDCGHSRTTIEFNLYFRLASRFDIVSIPDRLVQIRRHAGADHMSSETDTRPVAMLAERMDAAAYLIRTDLSRSDSFRAWLSERLLHLSLRRSEMTAQLGVDLGISKAEMRTLATIEIANLTEPGDEYILVNDGHCDPDFVDGRRAVPFLENDGQFWGPPKDSETAIRELERMRQRGIRILTILWPAFWWFDYYHSFRDHLQGNYSCLKDNSRLIAFDLSGLNSRKY